VPTDVHLKFADGEYRFALGLSQVDELQTKCGIGIGGLYARVLQGRLSDDVTVGHPAYAAFYAADLRETIRQGLIGGAAGMVDGADVTVSALRADQLVERYLPEMPLARQWDLAAAILYAKIEGYEPKPEEVDGSVSDDEKKNPTPDGSTTPAP
jgi:hypothetical protein